MNNILPVLVTSTALGLMSTASAASLPESCVSLFDGERLTIAVPNSAGGGYDTYARSLAPYLEKHGNLRARVTNMPSGGGIAARSFVMNSEPDELTMLIENTGDLVTAPMGNVGRGDQAEKDFMIDAYRIVGVVFSEPGTWIGKAGLDLADPSLDRLIASEGGLDEAMLPFFVTGRALGIEVNAVTGYEGTSEMTAAILRGEADISSMSLTTSKRRTRDEGVDILMVMSDGPYAGAPDLPYLAGEGSIVWELTKDLPDEEAAERRDLATAVTRIRSTVRGLFVSSNMSEDRSDCMAALVDIATADPEFVATAEAQGRPVQPTMAADAAVLVENLKASFYDVQPTIEEIAAEMSNN